MFDELKNGRRVAARYDKTAGSFMAFIAVASIEQWLPFVHEA